MNLIRKSLDIAGGTEIWDFDLDDFVGDASKDCWEYWNSLRRGEQAPFKREFDLLELNRHVGNSALLEWRGDKLLIKFCGGGLADYFDIDPTGHFLDELPNADVSLRRQIRSRDQVAPFVVCSPFFLARKDYQNYESINLPLLNEDRKANTNFVCFSFLRPGGRQK